MATDVPQKRFFDWFYREVTIPTSVSIRNKFAVTARFKSEDDEIPLDQRFTLWGDSDIPYLQQMMSPEHINTSAKYD